MTGSAADRPSTRVGPLLEVNREPTGRVIVWTVRALHAVLAPLTHRDWRGQEKLPREGGVVVVANHISNVDPLALGQYLAFSGRWPRFLAKASVFGVPVVGAVIRACDQIPVERGTASAKDAVQAAVDAVRRGRCVVLYPEGTISKDPDLWPMRGRTGAARIALQTGVPVVPVGQWGAQDVMYGPELRWPRLFPRATFRLVAGDPVPLDDLRGRPLTAAVLAEATERMTAAVTALVEQVRGEPAPPTRFDPRPDATGAAA